MGICRVVDDMELGVSSLRLGSCSTAISGEDLMRLGLVSESTCFAEL